MNPTVRRSAIVILVLFSLIFIQINRIQYFGVYDQTDARGYCTLYSEDYEQRRGSILAGDTIIAESIDSPEGSGLDYTRVYPEGKYFGNLTGYASMTYGANAIECQANTILNGTDDSFFTDQLLSELTGDAVAGADVHLTIDAELQKKAYDAITETGAETGYAVVLEPSTGKVLAQVSVPGFDPTGIADNSWESATEAWESLVNAENNPMADGTTQDWYAPGSTFKTIVAAAYIEGGHGDADTMVPAGNLYDPEDTDKDITNSNDQCGENKLTLKEAFARSCNTTFAQICNDVLDPAEITDMAAALGYENPFYDSYADSLETVGSQVGDVSNEAARAQACIGQFEVTATVLQNAVVAATVANDGVRMDPYLIDSISNGDGDTVDRTKDSETGKAFSSATAAELKKIMQEVVTGSSGTGGGARIDGATVGGKTGTAENDQGEDHGSFIGWAAASDSDEPEVAVAVTLQNFGSGGSSQSSIIAQQLMQYVLDN